MTQPLITLNCLVSGDRAKQVFPISIAPNKTVSILKKLIKLNYPHYFANINITDIQLVKVSLPLDEAPKAQEPSTVEGSEKIELPLKTISTVFNEPPLKDHVHIIVVKPTVQEANSSATVVDINCLFSGEGLDKAFSVEIASNEPITTLKYLIKAQWQMYAGMAASDIQLFKVSPSADDLQQGRDVRTIEGAQELSSPKEKISNLFPNPLPEGQVHVIALAPTAFKNN